MKKNNNRRHAVIIGSGIGGLSSAIILLKLGYDVSVIEKNRQPGGLMRSYVRRGIDCPVGVHYLGSMGNNQPLKKIFDFLEISLDLPVTQMGVNGGAIDKYFFDDFTFDLPTGMGAYEDNLRSNFPKDSDLITAVINNMKRIVPMLESLSNIFDRSSGFSNLDLFQSMGNLLLQYNCSVNLRSVLEVPCSWIGIPLDDCPAFYHHIVLLSYIYSSWKLKCTGSEMADLFVSKVKELGGKIILEDQVDKIISKDRIVKRVGLKSGESMETDLVIAAIHPKSVLNILNEGEVKPSYKNRINRIKNTTGIFSAHFTIDAEIDNEYPYNFFRLKTGKTGNLTGLTFFQIQKTSKNDINLLTLVSPSNYEDWCAWENTLTGQRGIEYLAEKNRIAEELLSDASGIAGPFKRVEILDTYTPLSIRDWVGSPDGSAYGVLRSREQLIKTAALNKISIEGLHLAGQNVLAPGILGTVLGSLAAVKEIVGEKLLQREFFK